MWEEGTFLDRNRLVRPVVQRLLATVNWVWSSSSTWSVLSRKSSPDLGVSIPSAVGQLVTKCLPNLGQNYDRKGGDCKIRDVTHHAVLKELATEVTDLQYTLKGI